jgi:hypothetical protein
MAAVNAFVAGIAACLKIGRNWFMAGPDKVLSAVPALVKGVGGIEPKKSAALPTN